MRLLHILGALSLALVGCNTFAEPDPEANSSNNSNNVGTSPDAGTTPDRVGDWVLAEVRAGELQLIRESDANLGFDMTGGFDGNPWMVVSLIDGEEAESGPRPTLYHFELEPTDTVESPDRSPTTQFLAATWDGTEVVPLDLAVAVRRGSSTVDLFAVTDPRPCPLEETRPGLAVATVERNDVGEVAFETRETPCGRTTETRRPTFPKIDFLDSADRRWMLLMTIAADGFTPLRAALPFDALEGPIVEGPRGYDSQDLHHAGGAGLAFYPAGDAEFGLWSPETPLELAEIRLSDNQGFWNIWFVESDVERFRYVGATAFGFMFWGEFDCPSNEAGQVPCGEDPTTYSDTLLPVTVAVAGVPDGTAFVSYTTAEDLNTLWHIARAESPNQRISVPHDEGIFLIEMVAEVVAVEGELWVLLAAVSIPSETEPFFRRIVTRALRFENSL